MRYNYNYNVYSILINRFTELIKDKELNKIVPSIIFGDIDFDDMGRYIFPLIFFSFGEMRYTTDIGYLNSGDVIVDIDIYVIDKRIETTAEKEIEPGIYYNSDYEQLDSMMNMFIDIVSYCYGDSYITSVKINNIVPIVSTFSSEYIGIKGNISVAVPLNISYG